MEARKLKLPKPLSLSPPSLLLDPISLSLSLSHSLPSLSLSNLSLSPLSSLPHPHTQNPLPNSSSAFIHLKKKPNSIPTTVFVSGGGAAAAVLLRFWVLTKSSQFAKARVFSHQKGLEFDESRFGLVFGVPHGGSIGLFGGVNLFALHSVSSNKIWVFAVRGLESGTDLKVMRCAVIECSRPVFSVSVDFGFLVLGEENGVRVFRLRPLVKGRVKEHRKDLDSGKKSTNGVKHHGSAKLRSVKLKQESKENGSYFVEFENKEKDSHEQTKDELQLAKANSVKALSPDKFLVLDSTGGLHLLCVSNKALASEIPFTMKQLPNLMKVRKLAVLPDISTKTRYVWISDGYHTVHAICFPGVDVSVSESSTKQCEDQQIQSSVSQAIFTSEKIQEMVPLATNAVVVLGQGSLFVYSIS